MSIHEESLYLSSCRSKGMIMLNVIILLPIEFFLQTVVHLLIALNGYRACRKEVTQKKKTQYHNGTTKSLLLGTTKSLNGYAHIKKRVY